MMSIDEDRLLSDLCNAAFMLRNLKNKNQIYTLYHDFIILNEMLYYNFRKVIMIEKVVHSMPYVDKIVLGKEISGLKQFIKTVDESQYFLMNLSNRFDRRLKNMAGHPYPFFDSLRTYNDKDFKDIILEYYNTFGNDIYKIVNRYFEESRIQEAAVSPDGDYDAFYAGLVGIDSGYIFLLPSRRDSAAASVLTHELGHAVDAERFLYKQHRSIPLFPDIFVEIPSVAFEVGFHSFLKEQHIDSEGSDILINAKTFLTNLYLKEARYALQKENCYITPDGYGVDDHGIKYDLRNGILYGMSGYFALHLNEIRKSSPKEFLKTLNAITTARNRIDIPQAIEMLGISEEDFLKGKMINKGIRENSLILKQRYKF